MKNMKALNNPYTLVSILSLLIIFGGTYIHTSENNLSRYSDRVSCLSLTEPQVTAHAYIVLNARDNTLIAEKHADAQLPLASLTKIMTALVARETLKNNDVISIPEDALTPEGDSGLFASELWRVDDLTDFTLMTSSNDGARALALLSKGDIDTFINAMNETARNAGLTQTFFLSETGLDVSSTTAGAYGSARDIASLLSLAFSKEAGVFLGSVNAANVYSSVSGFVHKAEHTSMLPKVIPGGYIIKTGFTDLAGGNLAVLAELMPGEPVAIVVLGSTLEERESDVLTLAKYAKSQLKQTALCNSL